MKRSVMKWYIFLCLTLFIQQRLSAQDDRYATGYMSAVSNHAVLFSGNRQQPLKVHTLNHQYFKDEDFVTGRLSYGGVVYPEVWLRWDLYKDELMILSPVNYSIVLQNDHIDFAELHGYRIFYLHSDGLPGCPPAGNYILLFSGNHLLIEKLINELNLKDNIGSEAYYFILSTRFYLQKNGVYHKIKSRRTLLKALDTHRKELRQFIRANRLEYKRDAETMVLEIVKKHEHLSRQ